MAYGAQILPGKKMVGKKMHLLIQILIPRYKIERFSRGWSIWNDGHGFLRLGGGESTLVFNKVISKLVWKTCPPIRSKFFERNRILLHFFLSFMKIHVKNKCQTTLQC